MSDVLVVTSKVKKYIKDAKSRALKPLRNEDGDLIEGTTFSNVGGASNEDMEDVYQIPVVGRIAAGLPITAIENTENILRIGQGMLGRTDSSDIFALTVSGDSMIEDGIFDGDYIFVKRQQDARDGEIVAAMVDGEATVKRLFREGERVRLQPANSTMEPIYVHAHEARETMILGKVVGVYRQLV